jgi:hypothetical protein
MIVKIQQSITTTANNKQCLIYSKSGRVNYQGDLPEDLEVVLRGRLKAYFKAKVVDTRIQILEEVKEQRW